MFSKILSSILLLALLFFVSCQKESSIIPNIEKAKQIQLIEEPIISSFVLPDLPCFEVAEEFVELAALIKSNQGLPPDPLPFTDFSGTLDNLRCPVQQQECIGSYETILYFDALDSSASPIEYCTLYCRDFSEINLPVSPATQVQIYDRAIELAADNRPLCPDSGDLMQVVGLDFYTDAILTLIDGEFVDIYYVELAVKYRCCDGGIQSEN